MKLWQKENKTTLSLIESFTIGSDPDFDLILAPFDVKGSLAHCTMLHKVGLLTADEFTNLRQGLYEILDQIENGEFTINSGVEDIHSQVEFTLTQKLGETGKKIHSGRSRNDQVLTDIKLYLRSELQIIHLRIKELGETLLDLSDKHKDDLLPGYTHFQLAMPSTFGLWFGAYAESLTDDLEYLATAFAICNRNPLGSGAGFGSGFPLDRELTTELLGFESMNYNSVYAQMTRGKAEKSVAIAMSSVSSTLSKLAYDVCLYMNQNFGFIQFPDNLTTGSSIMPHKKNPDVFELVRANCNRIQSLPNELTLLLNNLPSGYHRDFQLTKEILFPNINRLKSCLEITTFMLQSIIVNKGLLNNPKYDLLFTTEKVNNLVLEGVPFRDAYREVGISVENETFKREGTLNHTHEGSMGNLCNDKIRIRLNGFILKASTAFDSKKKK